MKSISARFIPQGSHAVEHELAVDYTRETVNATGHTRYEAIAYAGKATKRAFYESFSCRQRRDDRVANFFTGLVASAKLKAETRAQRNTPHSLKPGDVIHHSWGWEQTNCDFYQVLSVTANGATIQGISSNTVEGSEGFMSDRRTPAKDEFHGDQLKVRINGYNTVTTLKHGSAGKWDGRDKYCSWYA